MSTDPFIDGLINKTSPLPYKQIIILSQKVINDAFANMWALSDPDGVMRTIDIRTRDGQEIKGKLRAPSIIINVESVTPMLYFRWHFESGSMTLFTSEIPTDMETKTFDVTDWVVAFGTTLNHEDIPKTDTNYNDYVARMGVPADSEFSLVKLYFMAQETPGYYPAGSSFNGIDWSQESQAIQNHFEVLRMAWMDLMVDAGNTHVGVMLKTGQPSTVNQAAPTFPPTSIDYCVYPWKDLVNPAQPTNNSDSNALCYLIMTNNDPSPVKPPKLPDTSGTWVDADASESGRGAILCMGHELFWDKWLLPLIQIMNMATQIQPDTPTMRPGDTGPYINGSFTAGTCNAYPSSSDSYYNFTRSSTGLGWEWEADNNNLVTENSLQVGDSFWTLNQSSTANTRLTYSPGEDGAVFTLTGRNSASFVCCSKGGRNTYSNMAFDIEYTISYVAQRDDSGGLQILPSGSVEVTKGPVLVRLSDNISWTPSLEQWGSEVQDISASRCQYQLQSYENAFLEGLATQHKLFLPGAGSYLCNKVTFNHAGDLLTNLAFNGASPPGQQQVFPAFLRDAPPSQEARPFTSMPPKHIRSMRMKPILAHKKVLSNSLANGNQNAVL